MKLVGIICEYNPLHNGHRKQIDRIRHDFGDDCGIVCLMSGNFVQRGHPAIFDKSLRTHAALLSGADLVLELPVTCALSSAEGFAAGGVKILSGFCDYLCFGTETGDLSAIMNAAQTLLSPDFPAALKQHLQSGISFPAARQKAVEQLGGQHKILEQPNDILAVEYCKAILSQNSNMKAYPIIRQGNYHDAFPNEDNPSATAVRQLIFNGEDWSACVPQSLLPLYNSAAVCSIRTGEAAILYRLRTMTDAEFEALPYGSEGLWRRLMHAARSCTSLEDILTTVKTKRYTRTRLDRMIMCAFLGIKDLALPNYTRVLGFSSKGQNILRIARRSGNFLHTGKKVDDPHQTLEEHCDRLYGLFCENSVQEPAPKRRVIIYP